MSQTVKKEKNIKLNVTLNSVRQICSILIGLITFPYVTRALGADAYGRVSFCGSVAGYFGMIAALGFGTYAIREGAGLRNRKNDIDNFASRIFTLNLITTVFAYLLLGIFLLIWRRPSEYKLIVAITSVSMILSTIGMEWLYGIYEDYLYITVRTLIIQGLSLAAIFIFVKSEEDCIPYVIITTLGTGISNLFNYVHARKYISLRILAGKESLVHIRPVLILFFNAALVTIYLNSDVTILRLYHPEAVVGEYSVAVRIYTIVKSVIAAITVVTVPRLSYYVGTGEQEKFSELTNNILKCLITICLPVVTGLFMMSKDAVAILSGDQYAGGVTALQILCFALAFSTIANLLTSGVLIAQKQEKTVLIASVISAGTNLLLNFLVIPTMSLNGAAMTTLIAEIIVCLIAVNYSKRYVHLKESLRVFFPVLTGCLLITGCCIGVNALNLPFVAGVITKILSSALLYTAIQAAMKNDAMKIILGAKRNA